MQNKQAASGNMLIDRAIFGGRQGALRGLLRMLMERSGAMRSLAARRIAGRYNSQDQILRISKLMGRRPETKAISNKLWAEGYKSLWDPKRDPKKGLSEALERTMRFGIDKRVASMPRLGKDQILSRIRKLENTPQGESVARLFWENIGGIQGLQRRYLDRLYPGFQNAMKQRKALEQRFWRDFF